MDNTEIEVTEVTQRYLVRVYRRATVDASLLSGVVEVLGEARTVRFHDLRTLCEVFAPAPGGMRHDAQGVREGGRDERDA